MLRAVASFFLIDVVDKITGSQQTMGADVHAGVWQCVLGRKSKLEAASSNPGRRCSESDRWGNVHRVRWVGIHTKQALILLMLVWMPVACVI